jgi:single-strand DNA-binding protein
MTDTTTLTGLVATAPRHLITAEGYAVTSFRLASNRRRFDRQQKIWVDAGTNWYTVSTYRQLADNVAGSVQKGDRVLVTGRLRIRDWESGERKGTNIELDADSLGHDLFWGTSTFSRNIRATPVDPGDEPDREGEPDEPHDSDVDAETRGTAALTATPAPGAVPLPF